MGEVIESGQIICGKLDMITKIAGSDKNVLILGETGTGKELTAKMIHELSARKDKAFLAVNCANIPEDLFEAELFGYLKGSFTGAYRERKGLLEASREGSVFLDEIGELPGYMQAKMLRLIDRGEIRRIGENVTRKIAVRFIFATNRNLHEEARQGRFRFDLYFRISSVKICLTPLRERKEDIPRLARYFIDKENQRQNQVKKIAPEAMKKLERYFYPGNIRELQNIIERGYVLSEGDTIQADDIQLDEESMAIAPDRNPSKEDLSRVLQNCHWNKTKAAVELGKSRRQLYRLLEKYRLGNCIRRVALL